MTATYDVGGVLPDGTLAAMPRGTSVLVSGPAMVGKQGLAIRLLAAGHGDGDGILCVTTSRNAANIVEEFRRRLPSVDEDRIGIVDCSGSDDRARLREFATERVSSPGDLTGISIGTAKLLQHFSSRDVEAVRHGLVSVSTLLQYLDLETVFKFLHIYTSRIADTNGLGVFTVDDVSHDRQTINTITSEFDCVIELRDPDGGPREVRVRGLPGASGSWQSFERSG